MSLVNILDIKVLNNPAAFTSSFEFEITFECNAPLEDGKIMFKTGLKLKLVIDLEWKMIYVGAPETSEYDQVLESIMVGPIPVGVNKFVFSVRRCLLFYE